MLIEYYYPLLFHVKHQILRLNMLYFFLEVVVEYV